LGRREDIDRRGGQRAGGRPDDMGRNKFTTKMQKKLVVLFMIVLLAFAGLSLRLILINRDSGEQYKKQVLSQQQYSSTAIPYKRGEILDAKGTKLAVSEKVYDVVLDCKQMNDKKEYVEPTLKALGQYFGVDVAAVRQYAKEHPSSQYYVLAKRLSYDAISAFQKLANDEKEGKNIKGVWFEESYKRIYPNGSLASDVIGFTTSDGLDGTYGLEEYYDDVLSGINGREYGYLNDDSNVERTTKPAVDGYSIYSTVDATIQGIVEKYLKQFNEENKDAFRIGNGAEHAACIVMDINTAEVLAMADYPNFDLNNTRDTEPLIGRPMVDSVGNKIEGTMTQEVLDTLDNDTVLQNLNNLWKNYCISSTYEPGSVMKPFIAAMGLESGQLSAGDNFECTGVIEVGGWPIRCHNYRSGAEGWLTIGQSVECSCNVALVRMAQKIGGSTFLKYSEDFNFGLRTNIDLAGEARTASLVFNKNTLGPTELATSSFGQGFNVTMIQMITGFCAMVNGGYYYEPHLVSKITASDGSVVENIEPRLLKQVISNDTSALIRQYCEQVVYGEHGTGKRAIPPGYRIGGKTGTAETVSASGTRQKDDYVVSFMGYAPADDPQIAVYVVLDRPNSADQDLETRKACIIAKNIFSEVLPYLNIFMTEELSDTDKEYLEQMQIQIREDLKANAPVQDAPEQEGDLGEGGSEGAQGQEDGGAEGDGQEGSGLEDGSQEGSEGADLPASGVPVDPATGQPYDLENGDYSTPVSGVLSGNSGSGIDPGEPED